MSDQSSLAIPWKLKLRRARYQIVPVATMLVIMALATWLWHRHANTATATGEVDAVHVSIESKVEGVLEKLPHPVHVFDTVRNGQLIGRIDLSVVDKQVLRMRAELERMRATSQPPDPIIAEREAQIAELQSRLDAREIKSPIDGTITEIRGYPGEGAKLGKTIMVVASNESDFITGYLREDQPVRPAPGMKVLVRRRAASQTQRTFESYVESVAPQFEKMPSRHLRNPNVPEWVLPVQVAMPTDAQLTPGELVDIVFKPNAD